MILKHKDISVFFTDSGSGQALVFLHGFLENSSIWKPYIPTLSKKNRVVCIDLLGHGKTECLGYIHTMAQMAEVVKSVLNYLNIEQAYIFGHSMGGYVALAFAEQYLNTIIGLALINSTAQADSVEKQKNRDRAIIAVKENHRTFIQLAIPNLFKPENRNIFSKEITALKQEALKTPLQGIVAALEGMKIRQDREQFFKSSTFKKMMVIGKQDPVLDYKTLKNQVKDTDIKIIEFPDGHMSFIENREELLQKIVYFIE